MRRTHQLAVFIQFTIDKVGAGMRTITRETFDFTVDFNIDMFFIHLNRRNAAADLLGIFENTVAGKRLKISGGGQFAAVVQSRSLELDSGDVSVADELLRRVLHAGR